MSIQKCNNRGQVMLSAALLWLALSACARQTTPAPADRPAPPTPSPTATPTATAAPTAAPTASGKPTATAAPTGPVAANADWTPVTQSSGGVEMVLVPPGCFQMGSAGEVGEPDERPAHRQCIDAPFWLDRLEVTNAQVGSAGAFGGDDLPREEIDWFAAGDHCRARGARLPTEAEWEWAARGPDAVAYAWGPDFNGHILNWCDVNCRIDWRDVRYDDGYGTTAPVGAYPENASWVGALDMGGNVWEWTSSLYNAYPYDPAEDESDGDAERARVIRGGAWDHLAFDARTANRARVAPDYAFHTIGFRCAREFR